MRRIFFVLKKINTFPLFLYSTFDSAQLRFTVLLPLILETQQRYRHNALDGHEAKRGEMMDWSEHTHLTVPSARQRRDKNHGNHVAHYDRKRPSTNVRGQSMKMLPTASLIRLSLIRAFILVIEG